MALPVVIVSSGGLPVTEAANGLGLPVEIATNGFGVAVTPVGQGGLPINSGGAATSTTGMSGTTFWAAEGDSRTVGIGTSPATDYPDIAYNDGSLPWVVPAPTIVATGGATLTTVLGRAATTDALIASNPGYANYVLSILIGVNSAVSDYVGNTSGFLTALASYLDARRAAGWQVVLATELPAYTGTDETNYSAWRATVNAAIKTWKGVHCNAIADFAANSTIGPDGAQHNATYYTGDLHPINPAQAIMATIMENAVLTVGSNLDSDPTLSSQGLWSSSLKHADVSLDGTSRIATNTNGAANRAVLSVNTHVKGRRHIEIVLGGASNQNAIGAVDKATPYDNYITGTPGCRGAAASWVGGLSQFTQVNAPSSANFGPGHVFMMEVNFDLGKIWTGRDGVWDTNDPALLTNPNFTFRPHTRLYCGASSVSNVNSWTLSATPNYMSSGASPF